jgi:hypothetical protein
VPRRTRRVTVAKRQQSHGLKPAWQLASAVSWQESVGDEIVLATFDQQLWEAAKRAGLKAWPHRLPGATSIKRGPVG